MPTTTAPGPGESAYFAAGAHFGAERRRLELLEQRYDPVAFERLRAVGVAPGWRCLEVGAGGGSVARWLAEPVGPDGLVVASFTTASPDHPGAAGWNRAAAEVMAVVEGHALFAPNLGRRIPQLVAQTGLRIVAQDGRTSVRRGGDPVAHLLIKSFDHMAGSVAFAGAGAELKAVLAGLDDPTFEFVDATNFGVSARHEPPPSGTDLHRTAFA